MIAGAANMRPIFFVPLTKLDVVKYSNVVRPSTEKDM